MTPPLEFFNENEFNHIEWMDEEFLVFLDNVRRAANVPFILTSDARDPETNARVGGYQFSYHLYDPETGKKASAVDFVTPAARGRSLFAWRVDLWKIASAVTSQARSIARNVILELVQSERDWHIHLALRDPGDARPSKLILEID